MPISEANAQKWMSRMTPEELKELFGLQEVPASSADLDPKNLPNEDLQSFSYDGLSFEEAAGQLWRHTKILHYHAGTYNRQSEWFPIACAELEKDIRLAGSFCLTKAVLEKKGFVFKEIGNFTIESLCGLTAFYFRKCGKAFEDLYYTAGLVSLPMHEWERRWYMLGERLKATGEKIRKINAGEISVDNILKRIDPVQHKKGEKTDFRTASGPKPFYLMRTALPLIDSYAHEVLKERKYETHIRRQQQKIDALVNRAKSDIEKLEQDKNSELKPEVSNIKAVPVTDRRTTEDDPIGEKRKELIQEAKARGDTKAMMKIAAAPPEEIYRLWKMQTSVPHEPPPKGIKKTKKKRR